MMLIELAVVAALGCAIPHDAGAGERWAEFTCQEQVINALISMPPTPYDALVVIQALEREAYQKTQDCADLIDEIDRDYAAAIRKALAR